MRQLIKPSAPTVQDIELYLQNIFRLKRLDMELTYCKCQKYLLDRGFIGSLYGHPTNHQRPTFNETFFSV